MDGGSLVREVNERLVNRRDLTVVDEAFAESFVSHTGGHDVALPEFRAMIAGLLAALPDAVVTVDLVVAGQGLVAWRSITTGTHSAEWLGIAATGRRVSWQGIHIARVEGGRLQEHWGSPDMAGLLDQLS